jgi:sterol desaturase/sphingolipid hydroxylase (fatty acid hydroxylase superfamily)
MFDLIMALAQIFLGLFAENAGEWVFHRYVLHELGKRPNSLWNYHWSEHHRIARALFLVVVVIVHLPLTAILPLYVGGLYAGLILYYTRHRRSHLNPEWAKTHLPWHYEHHLSATVDANWCITWPWFDWLMGTRIRSDRTGTSR